MSTHSRSRKQLVQNMQSKAYRDAFVETHIRNGIAFQIRAMREAKPWKQKDLAEKIATKQEAVSRLENPDYGRFTLETLRKLASVFDVALIVRFAPFSKLIDQVNHLTPDDIQVPDYDHDHGLDGWDRIANVQNIFQGLGQSGTYGNISLAVDTDDARAVHG